MRPPFQGAAVVTELPRHAYQRVLPLFSDLGYHLSIAAVIAGTMPGQVFVDDPADPRVALISSPEGSYLASAGPPDAAQVGVAREMIERLHASWNEASLFAAPHWEQRAGDLYAGYRYALAPRRHYAARALAGAWHRQVPSALSLVPLDAEVFARPSLEEHHIQRWARGNWGSVEAFLERGFGAILFHGEEALSWSLADSAVGARCEIGIHTHPEYRRQGMATIVVAATVDHALSHGYEEVGWHCGEENLGSQGVAEKVGFHLTHRFHSLATDFVAAE
jgi:GNAT superfamily N-acetyltransferase